MTSDRLDPSASFTGTGNTLKLTPTPVVIAELRLSIVVVLDSLFLVEAEALAGEESILVVAFW
jgi:hypothetical protein